MEMGMWRGSYLRGRLGGNGGEDDAVVVLLWGGYGGDVEMEL